MSEEESGTLVDPAGILSSGARDEGNYFRVELPQRTPCTCKPSRWALMTLHRDDADCPRCHQLAEPPQERAAALLGDLAALFRDMPDTAGRVLGLVLILAALLGYLAAEGWIPR